MKKIRLHLGAALSALPIGHCTGILGHERGDTLGNRTGQADGEVSGTSSGMCSRYGHSQSHGRIVTSPGYHDGRGRGGGSADAEARRVGSGESDGTGEG